MKLLPLALILVVLEQATPADAATPAAQNGLTRSQCVATEPMPIADAQSSDPMPVVRADTTRLEHMPVARLVPRYLVK